MNTKNKKWLYYASMVCGIVVISLIISFGVEAYKRPQESIGEDFISDKTDRTLIKEIHSSQQEVVSLLKEIKLMLKDK